MRPHGIHDAAAERPHHWTPSKAIAIPHCTSGRPRSSAVFWLLLCDATYNLNGRSFAWRQVFRTNSSYGRWDEARKMWGLMVNRSRDFTRQTTTWFPDQALPPSTPPTSLPPLPLLLPPGCCLAGHASLMAAWQAQTCGSQEQGLVHPSFRCEINLSCKPLDSCECLAQGIPLRPQWWAGCLA